jgi:alkylation response protein AidB-like acyl-CoA dehydrogenase
MDFSKSQEVRQIYRTIDDFIEKEITPLEQEYNHFLGDDAEMNIIDGPGGDYRMCEEYLDVWEEVRKRSAEAGIYTMHMPEDVGGGGLDILPFAMIVEHIENRDPNGFHPLIWDVGTVSKILVPAYHDEYQCETYFEPVMTGEKLSAFALTEPEHGSDATYMDTSARKSGDAWVINGQKAFVSKGEVCDFLILHARTSGDSGEVSGITSFLIDIDHDGVTVDRVQRPMGGQPGRQAILHFNDCQIPEENVLGKVGEGFTNLIEWIGDERLCLPAKAVGRAQWLLDRAIEYAKQRETFGKGISEYQGIQFPLAEAATDVEQTRWLYRYAAWKHDRGDRAVKEQSMAKLRGSRLWNEVADVALQVHGGAGFMRSLPIEGQYREARASRIYEGTDEIQKRTIARELFGA